MAVFFVGACLLVPEVRAETRAAAAEPLVRMSFLDDAGQTLSVDGKIVTEATDGGVLLLARDGRLWTITPKKQVSREKTDAVFSMFNADELAQVLSKELGPRFEIVRTRHYVIATSTGPHYAQWCGALFEQLLAAFLAHWKECGLDLAEPLWPLPAVIFANEADFKSYAARDGGAFAEQSEGYYSIRSNRTVIYDLAAAKGKRNASSAAEMKRRAAAASFNVATIVHEATHQIAFNSGMHARFADNPSWLTEGMAMCSETPRLEGTTGWDTFGKINRLRYDRFMGYLRRGRPRNSLVTLVSRRDRFTDSRKAADAYAEAWALTFFLQQTRAAQYVEYLKRLAPRPPLVLQDERARLADFEATFGSDLQALDAQFVLYFRKLQVPRPGPIRQPAVQ